MGEPRNRVLAGERISRAQVEAAGDVSVEAIRAAVAACDSEAAATLAIARARRGEPVPVELVGEILPGIELPAITNALVAIATGDRTALLEVVERRRFPQHKDASELEAIALYAAWHAWRAGGDGRDPTFLARLIPELRRLSARSMTAEGYALLATIAATIENPNVAAATRPIAAFAKDYARQVAADERAMTAGIEDVIAALPAEVEASRGGFTVRAARQVGRNDPCPCGSGLKYKKCCADKPVAAPSPVPGLSWDEFLGSGADRMTPEHVADLELRDLVRVDLSRLDDKTAIACLHRYLQARRWDHAERVVEALATREGTSGADARDELVLSLLDAGELPRARAHVAKLPPDYARLYDLELAIADGPAPAWEALVRAAREAAGSRDKIPDLDLAYALLRAEPALGIVAARACVGTAHLDDGELLLDLVEEARDRLDLPPSDPAWDVLDALSAEPRRGAADADTEAALLRAQLQEASARGDQLERTVATLRAELADARTQPAAALTRTPEQPASGLEARVRELEALIREGNAERRELRKQLQATPPAEPRSRGHARTEDATRARRPGADAVAAEASDEGFAEDVALGARAVTLPRFDRRVADALADVPAAVASEAMRTIGTLAAGDGFAWRGVKQAKDMARQVLMARVGIHHRLLFRIEDGVMEVLDLITREQLMTTLKRLRGAR